MANAAEKVYGLIKDAVQAEGCELWDVRFVKEGATWYLRVFIDKPEGISIDDCTRVSHAIDPIIDEADPIDVSYYLEVSSPGLERELTRREHYGRFVGQRVKIKLYKALEGRKEYTGVLVRAGDSIDLEADGCILTIELSDIAKANLCDFEN